MMKAKRSRLSPEERRTQLLDCTRDIILARGFSSLTIEAVAVEANVSTPLMYKYFESRLSLLQALLVREAARFYSQVRERLEESVAFEQFVRTIVTTNFDEAANGNIHSILITQPDIQAGLDKAALRDSVGVVNLLIERTMEMYQLTPGQATKVVVFGSGASQAAALHWRRYGGDRQRMIDDVTKFILGGIEAFASSRQGD